MKQRSSTSATLLAALEQRALEECNNEPIETPGFIQEGGALLACTFEDLRICYASENIAAFFAYPLPELFNRDLRDLFGSSGYHEIANIASHRSALQQREHVLQYEYEGRTMDVSLYRSGAYIVLEIWPQSGEAFSRQRAADVRWVLNKVQSATAVQEILELGVQSLQRITGFDQVMVYRFLADESGEVMAEVVAPGLRSYKGLRFPAFDIPPRARKLFLNAPLRLILQTDSTGVSIVKREASLPELDMTLGILRGVSPVHLHYLRNMGTHSSLSLPLVINGRLWGLFAAHHHQKIAPLSAEATYSAELIAQTSSMAIGNLLQRKAQESIQSFMVQSDELVSLDTHQVLLDAFWQEKAPHFASLIPCDGLAYVLDQQTVIWGDGPPKESVLALADLHLQQTNEALYWHAHLPELTPVALGQSKGMFSLCLERKRKRIQIIFFRNAQMEHIHWAGNPQKELVVEKERVRLSPRSSFAQYQQEHEGHCELWTAEEIIAAELALQALQQHLRQIHRLQEDGGSTSNDRLKVVVKELQHRVRNLLNLVRSIARQSAQSEQSLDQFVQQLEKRLMALAEANSLLLRGDSEGVALSDILKTELSAFEKQVQWSGDAIQLPAQVTPILVLVFHELMTNATKYGALAVQEGRVAILWELKTDGLHIGWTESNGPKVSPPQKSGFGSSVIRNAIDYEFGGSVNMHFAEDGLKCSLFIPNAVLGRKLQKEVPSASSLAEKKAAIDRPYVLVLEDDYINATELQELLLSLVPIDIRLVAQEEAALRLMKQNSPSLAILDLLQKGKVCEAAASYCAQHAIPFFYLTGASSLVQELASLPAAAVLQKPYLAETLASLIKETAPQILQPHHG